MSSLASLLLIGSLLGAESAGVPGSAPRSGILVLGILTVESSYARNTERPSRGVPDTVQFWIAPGGAWRIRTYAIDHDIHPHSLGGASHVKKISTSFARAQIQKHYGDVLAATHVLEFADTGAASAVREVLSKNRLKGSLEVAGLGFAFWNPDGAKYRSKTTPESR